MNKLLTIFTLLVILTSCQKEQLSQVEMPNSEPLMINKAHQSKFPYMGTLFIDLDGATLDGAWSMGNPIQLSPSGITNPIVIDSIFNRITKAFSQFNLLVTLDSNLYLKTPVGSKQRLVLTQSNEWYTYGGIGGVSYTGSFFYKDTPSCFVFTKLFEYNWKSIAEASIHELGHSLGLAHQSLWVNGTFVKEYRDSVYMGTSYNMPYGGNWTTGLTPIGKYQDDVLTINTNLTRGLKGNKRRISH